MSSQFLPWDDSRASRWIRVPTARDDKYAHGVLGVMTGSTMYPGAAVLGVEGASRTGLGMVRYLGPERASDLVLARRPEVVTTSGRVQAWLVGSGIDADNRDDAVTDGLREALGSAVPAVIDAGALDLVDAATGPVVVTPHARELVRLLSARDIHTDVEAIERDPAGWAARAANEFQVTVLLKGNTTFVAAPDSETPYPRHATVTVSPTWLATAGTGDVLGGILGALVATHAAEIAEDAAALVPLAATAAYIHGMAADLASAGGPIQALDVAEAVPAAIRALLRAPEPVSADRAR